MKYVLWTLATMAFMLPSAAMADDFGKPFSNEAPLALEDQTTQPQDIEPAAGDEAENEKQPQKEEPKAEKKEKKKRTCAAGPLIPVSVS